MNSRMLPALSQFATEPLLQRQKETVKKGIQKDASAKGCVKKPEMLLEHAVSTDRILKDQRMGNERSHVPGGVNCFQSLCIGKERRECVMKQ